jgi:PAS domain-containing protein
MSTAKAIQIILARQLASCVAMPILLVDAVGTLIFYNEPAEAILNHRFEETGEIPAEEWNTFVTVVGDDRKPILPEDRPMWVARIQRKPVSRSIWMRTGETGWRHLQVTAFPLVGEADHLLGVMSIFWEV